MRILVACEESQAVCIAFREKGHEAFSCDLQPCSGGHPEWHLQCDIKGILVRDSVQSILHDNSGSGWDLLIAHPPCTYLANSGVSWLYLKDGSRNQERWNRMEEGAKFFKFLLSSDIPKIAIENPIPHKYALQIIGRKYDQIIQPWQFGHPEQKATCLWLEGLPKLYPTSTSLECQNNRTYSKMMKLPKRERERLHYLSPSPDRAKLRSKTFSGIAKAMAEQWG